jgi:hypothetical protein
MKNKTILIIAITGLMLSCSTTSNTIPVMVSLPDATSQPLARYDKVLADMFTITPAVKNLDAAASIKKYLLDDFAKAIDRDVETVDLNGDYFANPGPYTAELSQYSNAVLITGKITIDVKKRSIIKDFRDGSGKNSRRFVSIQHWQMKATIAVLESASGKVIFKREFSEKKSNVDPKDTLFTFEGMFFRIMDKVIKNFQKGKRIQKRFLLIK